MSAGVAKAPRGPASERLRDIARAALACFQSGGYRLTQIAHVSERLGVSVGSIYRYVDSKEALFHIAALEAAGEFPVDLPTPVQVSGHEETAALIGDLVARDRVWPVLAAALKRPAPDDPRAEAEAIAGELYDSMARRADMIVLLDRCARDIPALAEVFDDQVRRRLMHDLLRWAARRRLSGVGAQALTRGAMEAIAWLAKNRPHDPTAATIADTDARAAAVRIFARAFE